MFVVLEHELPVRSELEEIARGIATEEGELPEESELHMILDAAAGLTRMEAENAFSLSLVRQGRVAPDAVWELKTQTLKKSGLLSLYRGQDDFSSLGGLSSLKAFCKRALLHPNPSNHCGVPGEFCCCPLPDAASPSSARPSARKSVDPFSILMSAA